MMGELFFINFDYPHRRPTNNTSAHKGTLPHHNQHHHHQQQQHLPSPQAGGGSNATLPSIVGDRAPGTPNSTGSGGGITAKDGSTAANSESSPAPPLSPGEDGPGQGSVFTVLTPVPSGPTAHVGGRSGGAQGTYTPLPSIGQFSSKLAVYRALIGRIEIICNSRFRNIKYAILYSLTSRIQATTQAVHFFFFFFFWHQVVYLFSGHIKA